MKKSLLNIFTDYEMKIRVFSFSVVFLFLLFSVNTKAQHFESVEITGVVSGQGTQDAVFTATSPTIPSLARIRVRKVSGTGTVSIFRPDGTGTWPGQADNFVYRHISGFTSGIPNNISRMEVSFLTATNTPIPVNDFRLVIDDIDGPNNEGIYTDCGSAVRYTALAIPSDLTLNTTPPNLGAIGTKNENSGAPSRIMFEYNDVSTIYYTIYANNAFLKEFDLNYDDFPVNTPKYAVCTADFDGDGISDSLDLDDDNDGITDKLECGGNDPNGDADGDGLPNYLDTLDNRIAANNFGGTVPADYVAARDSSVTNYTDANGDGVPDVYAVSTDNDGNPNHLDLDSDGDGCYDALEGDENVTPAQLNANGSINTTANGGVGTTVGTNNGVPNLVNAGGAADIGADAGQGINTSQNTALKEATCYTLTLSPDSGASATGTYGTAFTVPNVLTNDTLDGVAPVIGTNPGQVTISQSSAWPAGISLNTSNGTVSVAASVPAGVYTLIYQVCVNGGSPALCKATTVTIAVKLDTDGDGKTNDVDLDDDNDGIIDTTEGSKICGAETAIGLTSANGNAFSVLDGVNSQGAIGTNHLTLTAMLNVGVTSTPVINNSHVTGAGFTGYSININHSDTSISGVTGTSIVSTINFEKPIDDLKFRLLDLDDLDYVKIDAYDANGNLINLTASMYSFSSLVTTNVSYLGANKFASTAASTTGQEGMLNLDYTGNTIKTLVFTYSDGTLTGSYSIFDLKGKNCTEPDADGDGIPNSLDLDSDNDGLLDIWESLFYVSNIDPDGDGKIGTGNTPPDADGDGLADIMDPNTAAGATNTSNASYFGDRDGDGIKNQFDIDSDNDGIVDNIEGQATIGYVAPTGIDTDKDGIDNAYDVNSGGDGIGHVNSDGGSAPDYVDTDSENDGIKDLAENHLGVSGSLDPAEVDANNDGVLDLSAYTDSDGDGLADIFDLVNGITTANNVSNNQTPTSMPNTQASATPERDWRETLDSDADGVPDATDVDDDNDGILDTVEGLTTDKDGDGIPDYLDLDSDNDGIYDVIEAGGTDPDNDGHPGTTPAAGPYPPVAANGLPSALGGTPLTPGDFDGDGILNYLDLDSDNDGIYDVLEAGGTDANNDGTVGGASFIDIDSDGINDIVDGYDNITHTVMATGTPLPVPNTDAIGGADYIDTDSDGDGCFDAIEGTGNITAAQLNGSGAITGGVNATTGVPNATPTGQGVGFSQNILATCLDTDNDGYPDGVDLDDDNDGILDTVEAPCTSTQAQWSHNASGGQSDFVTFENDTTTTSPNFTSGANITFGAGLDETTDNYSYTYLLRGASTLNFEDAKTANDYAQVSYTPSKKMTLNALNFGFYTNSATDPEFNCGNFRLAVEYSTNSSFSSPTLLLKDIQVGIMIGGGYVSINNTINNLLLQSGSTYYFRIYLYNEQNTDANSRVRIDDVFFNHCLFVDTDGDGIPNDLDTDADGDGCSDAIEGAGNITTSQVISGQITGGVDTNGVPTAAAGGQAAGASTDSTKNDCVDTDADGVADWQDLDNDNDGILDTVECPSTPLSYGTFNIPTPNDGTAINSVTGNNGTISYTIQRINSSNVPINIRSVADSNNTAILNTDISTNWTSTGFIQSSTSVPQYLRFDARDNSPLIFRVTFSSPIINPIVNISGTANRNIVTSVPSTLVSSALVVNGSNPAATATAITNGASVPGDHQLDRYNLSLRLTGSVTTFDINLNQIGAPFLGIDNAGIAMMFEPLNDSDGDGIRNCVDIDSDNDGCPDAIEGGGAITSSQLTSGHITGAVDANGVPTAASGGQTLGNAANASLKDPACYTLALDTNSSAGSFGTAFNVATVLGNDTLDGAAPVIGTNPGQVTISQTGVWPAGITLNADGTVSVGSTVPIGTYNVTYQVCVNGTSPALCQTSTVTIDIALGCNAGTDAPILQKN